MQGQIILKKIGGLTLLDFKTYHSINALVLKTVWYYHKHIDQWSRIENPDINSRLYAQLIFQQGCSDHSMGKELTFQHMM